MCGCRLGRVSDSPNKKMVYVVSKKRQVSDLNGNQRHHYNHKFFINQEEKNMKKDNTTLAYKALTIEVMENGSRLMQIPKISAKWELEKDLLYIPQIFWNDENAFHAFALAERKAELLAETGKLAKHVTDLEKKVAEREKALEECKTDDAKAEQADLLTIEKTALAKCKKLQEQISDSRLAEKSSEATKEKRQAFGVYLMAQGAVTASSDSWEGLVKSIRLHLASYPMTDSDSGEKWSAEKLASYQRLYSSIQTLGNRYLKPFKNEGFDFKPSHKKVKTFIATCDKVDRLKRSGMVASYDGKKAVYSKLGALIFSVPGEVADKSAKTKKGYCLTLD